MKNLLRGLAGAIALNILHETYKKFDGNAPRVDLVGEEAVSKISKSLGKQPLKGRSLYMTTLGADIISNALYYSLIGQGNTKNIIPRAMILGTAAGVGTFSLSKPLGLNDAPVARTAKTKVLTVT